MSNAHDQNNPGGGNPPAVASFEDFFTRDRANEGQRLPLSTPDGKKTAHYIICRGVDSDHYISARNEANRKIAEFVKIENDKERQLAINAEVVKMRASLVAAWSFDDPAVTPKDSPGWKPCTLENVIAFLRQAPQIANMIDAFASNRTVFFRKPLTD